MSEQERMDIVLGAVNDFSSEFENFKNGLKSLNKQQRKNDAQKKKSEKRTKALKAAMNSLKKAILGVAAAGLGAFGAAIWKSVDGMSAMAKEAQKIQITTSEMSRLAYIGDQTGVKIDDVVGSVEELRMRMAEASQDGTGPLGLAFKKLGLDAQAMLDLPVSEQLGQVGDALKKLNASDRQFLADEIFGGDAVRMMGFINQGSEGIKKLSDRADELGITMSDSGGKAAGEFKKAWKEMFDVVQGIMDTMLEPVIRWLAGFFRVMSNAINQWDVTWRVIVDTVSLAMLGVWEDIKDLFMRKIPTVVGWFIDNGVAMMRDYYMLIATALKNIAVNFTKTFQIIASSIADILLGRGTDGMWSKVGKVWAGGILEGFEATVGELPVIAERERTTAEKALAASAAEGVRQLMQGTTDLTAEEATGEIELDRKSDTRRDRKKGLLDGIKDTFNNLDLGKGMVGQMKGDSNRFLQTGRSIKSAPEEKTAKNTEQMKKELKKVEAGVNTVNSVLSGFAAAGGQAMKVIIQGSEEKGGLDGV